MICLECMTKRHVVTADFKEYSCQNCKQIFYSGSHTPYKYCGRCGICRICGVKDE